MADQPTFRVEMERIRGFEYRVKFDWESVPEILMDEPEPLGERQGPNAARLLGAAVANCLSASLLFCLQRSRMEVSGMKTRAVGTLARNEAGRTRVSGLDVRIEVDGVEAERVKRCRDLFEDFCIVSTSVRSGIPIRVEVYDSSGVRVD